MKILRMSVALACLAVCSEALAGGGSSRQQAIEDARAMVRESWASDLHLIAQIETGRQCGVVDQLSSGIAIHSVEGNMQDELIHAGLFGDHTMDIIKVAGNAIRAGRVAFSNGACNQMTPASRGRLRLIVESFMH